MTEKPERIGGNITLINFNKLEPAEIIVVKKIIGTFVKKIAERTAYKEIRVRLKESRHSNQTLHEIQVDITTEIKGPKKKSEKVLAFSSEGYNLYSAISDAFKNALSGIEHNEKKE